jgi:hypothetical protein
MGWVVQLKDGRIYSFILYGLGVKISTRNQKNKYLPARKSETEIANLNFE